MADFVNVGKTDDFQVGVIRGGFKVEGRDVAVVNMGPRFFAFSLFCPHQGAELTQGYVTAANEVVCMLHDSAFSLETGALLDGPGFDELPLYDVRVEGEDVLVGARA